jgi:hypothetical protein
MEGLAKQVNDCAAGIFSATVKSILEEKYLLVDHQCGRVTKAKRAASCLLEPRVGDRVLAANVDDENYVLAVLTRERSGSSAISIEGDVQMSIPSGRLEITAKDGMALQTPEALSLVAGRLELSGAALAAAFHKIDLFGHAVETHLTDVKLFSKRLQSKVESAVQQFTSRHAKVDGVDSVTAGNLQYTAKAILAFQSALAFIKARKNVKIDGKQILLG